MVSAVHHNRILPVVSALCGLASKGLHMVSAVHLYLPSQVGNLFH